MRLTLSLFYRLSCLILLLELLSDNLLPELLFSFLELWESPVNNGLSCYILDEPVFDSALDDLLALRALVLALARVGIVVLDAPVAD